jgi:hypothetical protein
VVAQLVDQFLDSGQNEYELAAGPTPKGRPPGD